MEMYDYGLSRRFGMALGLRVGMMWLMSFLIVVYCFPSIFSDFGVGMGILSLPVAGIQLRRFMQNVDGCNGFRIFWTAWFTYMCAMLITTAGQYAYFSFLDDGRFVNNMVEFYENADVKAMNEMLLGSGDMPATVSDALTELTMMTTRELMIIFMSINIFISLAFSGFSMLFTIGARRAKS